MASPGEPGKPETEDMSNLPNAGDDIKTIFCHRFKFQVKMMPKHCLRSRSFGNFCPSNPVMSQNVQKLGDFRWVFKDVSSYNVMCVYFSQMPIWW